MGKGFRHEFMSLIWVRQQDPFQDTYKKCTDEYIPQRCSSPGFCSCGMPLGGAGTCLYCQCTLSQEVSACAQAGKLTLKMKQILDEAQK